MEKSAGSGKGSLPARGASGRHGAARRGSHLSAGVLPATG